MSFDSDIHHRRSIRLAGYDYSQMGAYFVTICTRERRCLFGDVVDGEMRLNPYGAIVTSAWQWLAGQYPYVALDECVVMPNHLHGIIEILDCDRGVDSCRGGSRTAPTKKRKPLGRIIGAFKTVSTKRINKMRHTPAVTVWQRNYYEHIIRNETDWERTREYIAANPALWDEDKENPNSTTTKP